MKISPRLNRIQQAVQRAERQLVRHGQEHYTWPNGFTCFATRGRLKPSYGATDPLRFLLMIREVKRSGTELLVRDQHMAILGSGVGMSAFTAADHFKWIVGFEADPQLVIAAENIRQQFGILNIDFRLADFLKADLSGFDVIYFYRPFLEQFHQKMANKLLETRPGTIIMARDVGQQPILPSQTFQLLYPRQQKYSLDLFLSDFHAYLRK